MQELSLIQISIILESLRMKLNVDKVNNPKDIVGNERIRNLIDMYEKELGLKTFG